MCGAHTLLSAESSCQSLWFPEQKLLGMDELQIKWQLRSEPREHEALLNRVVTGLGVEDSCLGEGGGFNPIPWHILTVYEMFCRALLVLVSRCGLNECPLNQSIKDNIDPLSHPLTCVPGVGELASHTVSLELPGWWICQEFSLIVNFSAPLSWREWQAVTACLSHIGDIWPWRGGWHHLRDGFCLGRHCQLCTALSEMPGHPFGKVLSLCHVPWSSLLLLWS